MHIVWEWPGNCALSKHPIVCCRRRAEVIRGTWGKYNLRQPPPSKQGRIWSLWASCNQTLEVKQAGRSFPVWTTGVPRCVSQTCKKKWACFQREVHPWRGKQSQFLLKASPTVLSHLLTHCGSTWKDGGGAWGSEGLACISTRNEKFACASEAPGRKTALDTSEGDFIPA